MPRVRPISRSAPVPKPSACGTKSIATAACVLLVWAAAQSAYASTPPHDAIRWLRSDTAAFAQARAQHRYVILYLEAVWCHWCNVMDEKTYGDAAVREEIAAHYVPLRIDQGSVCLGINADRIIEITLYTIAPNTPGQKPAT